MRETTTKSIIEDNTENILKDFYGVTDASAMVVGQADEEYIIEAVYEGELRNDPRAFVHDTSDLGIQTVGIAQHLSDNKVEMSYVLSPGHATLSVEPLIERFGLDSTDHERVYTKNSVTSADVKQGKRLARNFDDYIVLSKTDIMQVDTDWGYLNGYNLITVAFETQLTRERTNEIINEIHESNA